MKIDRRTQLREVAFLILFRLDFYQAEDMEEQIKDFFYAEEDFTDEERQGVADKIVGIMEHIEAIDALLNKYSIGWKVKRMSKVDLTILRLACYEIKFDEQVPTSTAINDAVELAKNYGEANSPSFINGLLASVAKDEQ